MLPNTYGIKNNVWIKMTYAEISKYYKELN